MFNQLVMNRNESPDSPLAHPGAPPNSESARQSPLPGTPYEPYSEKPAVPEPPYKPYAEKTVDEAPYEPYKDIQSWRQKTIMQLSCAQRISQPLGSSTSSGEQKEPPK